MLRAPVQLALRSGLLRGWTAEDAPVLLSAWQDFDISRWNAVPSSPSLEMAEHWISGVTTRLHKGLSIDLVIDAGSLGVVGEVGLSGFNARYQGAQIGYWVLPAARGRGLAVEAVNALCSWAFDALDLRVVVARCAPANAASQAVAARSGFALASIHDDTEQIWQRRAPSSIS